MQREVQFSVKCRVFQLVPLDLNLIHLPRGNFFCGLTQQILMGTVIFRMNLLVEELINGGISQVQTDMREMGMVLSSESIVGIR